MAEVQKFATFEITLVEDTTQVAEQAAADINEPITHFLSWEMNKMLRQKKVQYARQRLNLHKRTICMMIQKNAKGFDSLEQAYISLGLSESVTVFGGIRKVYDEIYVKTGNPLPPSKIRINGLEVVNAK
jgi:hypothetical protein